MIFLPMEKKENPKKNELSNAFNVFAILYCTEKKAILFLLYSLSLALRSCCSRLLTSFKSHTQSKSLYISHAMSYFHETEFNTNWHEEEHFPPPSPFWIRFCQLNFYWKISKLFWRWKFTSFRLPWPAH